MFIYHVIYFNDLSRGSTFFSDNLFVDKIGVIARTMFIFIAGLSLSYVNKKSNKIKRLKRSLEIAIHALIITLVTYYFYPDYFIRFGILHFFAVSTFLLSFIAPYPKITLIIFLLSLIIVIIGIPKINPVVDTITGASIKWSMMDWFPLNKWLPVILAGLLIGQRCNLSKLNFNNFLSENNILTKIGQNSLQLYTGHIVVLIIFFYYLKKK
jgi:uncharacterized membrane protein